jgi:hypothetical protein
MPHEWPWGSSQFHLKSSLRRKNLVISMHTCSSTSPLCFLHLVKLVEQVASNIYSFIIPQTSCGDILKYVRTWRHKHKSDQRLKPGNNNASCLLDRYDRSSRAHGDLRNEAGSGIDEDADSCHQIILFHYYSSDLQSSVMYMLGNLHWFPRHRRRGRRGAQQLRPPHLAPHRWWSPAMTSAIGTIVSYA